MHMPHTLPLPVRATIGPLGRRLLVLFIAVLALSLVGSAIGLWSLLRIGQSTDDMVQRSVTNERLVADAYRLQAINAERYKAVALSSEPEVGETLGADIAETQRQYDALIDTLLTPITAWWLGLPAELGVPILFGVLRKELSLLMIQQALGTPDVGDVLNTGQIFTFLVFLTFYVPCLSTFAVMLKTLGRREAWLSVGVSLACALLMAGVVRLGAALLGLYS